MPDSGYRLDELTYDNEFICFELVSSGKQEGVFASWEEGKRSRSYEKLMIVVGKIKEYGPLVSSRLYLRCLDSEVDLFEIKGYDGAHRVMCVLRDEAVLLFHFKGHSGTGSIPPKDIKKARRLAKIAIGLLDEADERKPEERGSDESD